MNLSRSFSVIGAYIKLKHDCRITLFTYLLIFIYHSFFKHRTATNDNAKDQPKGFFDCPLGFGGNKLHGTTGDNSRCGCTEKPKGTIQKLQNVSFMIRNFKKV